jgi:hypothetical protein
VSPSGCRQSNWLLEFSLFPSILGLDLKALIFLVLAPVPIAASGDQAKRTYHKMSMINDYEILRK